MSEVAVLANTTNQQSDHLYKQLHRAYVDRKLPQPAISPTILELVHASLNEHTTFTSASKLITADPVLAGEIITRANGASYFRREPVRSVPEAIRRLGLGRVCNIALTSCLNKLSELFPEHYKAKIKQLNHRSRYLSAIAYVLCDLLDTENPDTALLAALVSDIGYLPLLQYAAAENIDLNLAMSTAQRLQAQAGVWILHEWRMPIDIAHIPTSSRRSFNQPQNEHSLTLSEIIACSRLLVPKSMRDENVPPLQYTAIGRLVSKHLGAQVVVDNKFAPEIISRIEHLQSNLGS